MPLFQIKIQKFCVVSNSFRYFSEAFSTLKKETPKLKSEYKQLKVPIDILSTKILKPYYDDRERTKYFARLLKKAKRNMKSGFPCKTRGFYLKKTPNSSLVKIVANTKLKNFWVDTSYPYLASANLKKPAYLVNTNVKTRLVNTNGKTPFYLVNTNVKNLRPNATVKNPYLVSGNLEKLWVNTNVKNPLVNSKLENPQISTKLKKPAYLVNTNVKNPFYLVDTKVKNPRVDTKVKNPSFSSVLKNKQSKAFSHLLYFPKLSSLYSKEIPVIEPPKQPVIRKPKDKKKKQYEPFNIFAHLFKKIPKRLIKPKKKEYLLKFKRGLLNSKPKFHLGHTNLKLKRSWNNYLNNFYLGNRNNTTIFRREFTYMHMAKALHIFTRIVSEKKNTILIINTNPELSRLVTHMQKIVKNKNVWFSDCGWTKGTLTNSDKVFTTIQTFIDFYYNYDSFINKNTIHFPIYKKLKKNYKGFVVNKQPDTFKELQNQKSLVHLNSFKRFSANLKTEKHNSFDFYKKNTLSCFTQDWKPDLILFMSNNAIQSILREAEKCTIPTIAFIDSDHKNSSQNVTYPIPGNTNSYMLIWFFFNLISQILGKKIVKTTKKNAENQVKKKK